MRCHQMTGFLSYSVSVRRTVELPAVFVVVIVAIALIRKLSRL